MSDLDEKLVEVQIGNGKSRYYVNRDGDVYWQYSTRFKRLSGNITDNGYRSIIVGGKRHLVHRIVARAFIANPDGKRCVNHIDGNKLNNSVSNLEWTTHSENTQHAFRTGLQSNPRGSASRNAKLTESKVSEILQRLANGETGTSLAKEYGVTHGRIYDIKHGRGWTHVKAAGIE